MHSFVYNKEGIVLCKATLALQKYCRLLVHCLFLSYFCETNIISNLAYPSTASEWNCHLPNGFNSSQLIIDDMYLEMKGEVLISDNYIVVGGGRSCHAHRK